LHEAHAVMCDGQALDLTFETSASVERDAYFEMIGAKTAALFAASAGMGALCAPCDDATVAQYRTLGREFGIAFQIRDDVLGVWASRDETGKTAGHDIVRRKWTYPVVWALAGPPSRARDVVAAAYADRESLDATALGEVVAALDSLGAREAANRAIAKHVTFVQRHPVASVRDFLLGSMQLQRFPK
ncbi:MAG: polyprenyl synthetase family protein, partial [Rhodanobacteraceae bacterium]